ncbi:hypothetical protein M409DRAFT_30071 [Zasmidium cellare ATCC 36951]|uniref:Glutathione S-transferase n=1 Tax=Zasmidium cellare ATCC 36951 TaxID=1080233 RepID=A0A6A6BXX6_ZASCE|nr:uncharacterized protein M409DRAFT_30071 [Zasmidium cellare ATCC 36951]KAF2159453.1 hypothetical protein M409DRAFT_30071 [Zasmidium cellare ATCC 36951]
MPPKLTLYRRNGSCSMVSHILLTELAIPFTSIQMAPGPHGYEAADKSFTHAEYVRDMHPSGYVPALSVDGEVITENPAILRYIANLAPDRKLLGATAMQNAKVDEWLNWLSGSLHGNGFGAYWRPARFSADEGAHISIQAKGFQNVLSCFDRIDQRVDGEHAVGEELTVVDVYLHTFYRWGHMIGVDMGQYPRYGGVARKVEKLESVKRIMAEEGEKLLFSDET